MDPTTFAPIISTYSGTNGESLKAVSANYLCALIYDSASASLKIIPFTSTTAVSTSTVSANFYTGLTLTDANITFDVSDDCNGFRINKVIGHLNPNTTQYQIDTYPSGTTELTNPAFSEDFTIAVTDTGIYSHTVGTIN